MKTGKIKTSRFATVVAECGSPEIVTLWSGPQLDKPFQRAIKQNRLLSIKQEMVGSKKDFGVVGFLPEKNMSYLIFPTSLKAFEGHRIVGINYELLPKPEAVGKSTESELPKKVPQRKTPRGVQPRWEPSFVTERLWPSAKHFKVTIRFVSQLEVIDEVEAGTKSAAVKLAEQRAQTPDFSRGTITRRILKVVRSSEGTT